MENAEAQPGEAVLEIGAGLGVLTERLLAADLRVTAIEIDPRLSAEIRHSMDGAIAAGRLRLIDGDALAVNLSTLYQTPDPALVVANLPYAITTPILEKLVGELPEVRRMVLMIQDDAYGRLSAVPGSKAYGPLAIVLAVYGSIRKIAFVSRTHFDPPPHVDSCLIRLDRHPGKPPLDAATARDLADFVRLGFSSRRKTWLNNLRADGWPQERVAHVGQLLSALGYRADVRPERITPDHWTEIHRLTNTL